MRPNWKEILILLNTSGLAGLLFYLNTTDSNGAVICTLTAFSLSLMIYSFLGPWKKGPGNR